MAISCQINAHQKIVIDQSGTVSKGAPYSRVLVESVIDRSMTLFHRLAQNWKGKGVIMSREQLKAAVKARKPHFEETKRFCLSKVCT